MWVQKSSKQNPKLVLAIDGGGIRGILPLKILAYIEDQLGRPISEVFDVIAGTSTGAIIATLLTLPMPHTAENALNIYKVFGKQIFRSSWLQKKIIHWVYGTRYSDRNLLLLLESICGQTTLGELKSIVAFPAYDIANMKRVTYENLHDTHRSMRVSDVIRSCVAAPTYFSPLSVNFQRSIPRYNVSNLQKNSTTSALVDGGVFANNAANFAYNFVKRSSIVNHESEIFLLSLGTGTRYYDRQRNQPSCSLGWCSRIPDLFLTSESQEIDDEIKTTLGRRYLRIQGEVRSHRMDDTSSKNIKMLEEDAAEILAQNKDKIDAFCALLKSLN